MPRGCLLHDATVRPFDNIGILTNRGTSGLCDLECTPQPLGPVSPVSSTGVITVTMCCCGHCQETATEKEPVWRASSRGEFRRPTRGVGSRRCSGAGDCGLAGIPGEPIRHRSGQFSQVRGTRQSFLILLSPPGVRGLI